MVSIQFQRDWISGNGRIYRAGRVLLDQPGGWAKTLISRGIAIPFSGSDDAQVQPPTKRRPKRRTG